MNRGTVTVEGNEFVVAVKRDRPWWIGTVDDLPGCHARARSLAALRSAIAGAIYDCQFAEEPEVDAALIAEVERRQSDPNNQRTIPWEDVKAALGL
jgi:hypothetical protein